MGYRRLGADSPQAELDLFASYDVLQAGSRVVIDGLGLVMGHGMSRFDFSPNHPNRPEPGTRVYLRAHWGSDVGGGWGRGAAVFALLGAIALVVILNIIFI